MKLYVHVPFCKSKCLYCDFKSFPCCDSDAISRYLSGLNREIALAGKEFGGRRITSVYVGGGTPSLLSTDQLSSIFDTLKSSFNIPQNAEFTVECNPESIDRDKLALFSSQGVNRISLGIQSLSTDNLRAIGRVHDRATALSKIALVKEYFDNLSVDFIVGLPYDTFDIVKEELDAVAPMVSHLSVYMLQIEDGTPLSRLIREGRMTVPDEDMQVYLFTEACKILQSHGFERYEVSNFSKDGRRSSHNVGYWTREEYLGLGLGASGLIKYEISGVEKRVKNTDDIQNYLLDARNSTSYYDFNRDESILSSSEIFEEEVMLGLRLSDGVSKAVLGDSRLQILTSKYADYVVDKGDRVALSGEGMDVMNTILIDVLA